MIDEHLLNTNNLALGMSAQLPHNLPTLQNLLRRDPQSYKEEFNVQYEYLKSKLALFHLSPSAGK